MERIIEEFRATLNHKYPVAEDFENVYKYIYDRLIEANIKKDTAYAYQEPNKPLNALVLLCREESAFSIAANFL